MGLAPFLPYKASAATGGMTIDCDEAATNNLISCDESKKNASSQSPTNSGNGLCGYWPKKCPMSCSSNDDCNKNYLQKPGTSAGKTANLYCIKDDGTYLHAPGASHGGTCRVYKTDAEDCSTDADCSSNGSGVCNGYKKCDYPSQMCPETSLCATGLLSSYRQFDQLVMEKLKSKNAFNESPGSSGAGNSISTSSPTIPSQFMFVTNWDRDENPTSFPYALDSADLQSDKVVRLIQDFEFDWDVENGNAVGSTIGLGSGQSMGGAWETLYGYPQSVLTNNLNWAVPDGSLFANSFSSADDSGCADGSINCVQNFAADGMYLNEHGYRKWNTSVLFALNCKIQWGILGPSLFGFTGVDAHTDFLTCVANVKSLAKTVAVVSASNIDTCDNVQDTKCKEVCRHLWDFAGDGDKGGLKYCALYEGMLPGGLLTGGR